MADAYDPNSLQGLLSQFQPSDADRRAARSNALLTLGLGLLGARKGLEMDRLGQAGLLAMHNYQDQLSQAEKQRMQGMQAANMAMTLREQQQKFADEAALRQAMGAVLPASLSATNPMQAAMAKAPSLSPTTENVAAVTQQAASQPAPGVYERLNAMADQLDQQAIQLKSPAVAAKAQEYRQLAEKYAPKYRGMETVMQDGKPVVLQTYENRPPQPTQYMPKPDYKSFNTGDTSGFIDPLTQTMGPTFTMNPTPGERLSQQTALSGQAVTVRGQNMADARAAQTLAEQKRYHNLELGVGENGQQTNIEGVAQAIANYQQPGLSSWAMAKPIGSAIMSRVMELNPNYDAKNFATAQQTMNAFARGQQGNTTRSINVAMQHLDVLGQAADALNNKNYPLFNQASNYIKTQMGQAAPTNFNSVKDIVANEITKAIVGSGGGVTDRDKAQQTVRAANSPAQLKTVIDSYKQLFTGQLAGLQQQYEASSQRKDFNKFLSPETQALMHNGTPQSSTIDDLVKKYAK